MNKKMYAVLTGDLVKSSKLTSDESQKAMKWLRQATDKIADMYPKSIEGCVDTFRHDSWQLLLAQPSLCLRRSPQRAQRFSPRIRTWGMNRAG